MVAYATQEWWEETYGFVGRMMGLSLQQAIDRTPFVGWQTLHTCKLTASAVAWARQLRFRHRLRVLAAFAIVTAGVFGVLVALVSR